MKRNTTYRKMQGRDLFFEEDKTRDAMHGMGNPLDRVREMTCWVYNVFRFIQIRRYHSDRLVNIA